MPGRLVAVSEAVVRRTAVEQHQARMPHAQIHIMPHAGHAPFWDDAASFNRRLSAFWEEVATVLPAGR
jgi:non-heme chloroperoxidase